MYNVSTSKIDRVTTSGLARNPKIYGDRIVYQVYRNGKNDIYLATIISNPLDNMSSENTYEYSRSSGGSSGAAGSPEPSKNVQAKELSQAFVTSGKAVKFDFPKNATCVVYVSFDAKKTFGKTTTIAEQLKNKSTLVSGLPEGEIYKSFNVWVGNGGIATSKNIENPAVCFKVERSWIKDKNIDKSSIILNRYSDKKWEQFPANLSGQDDKYLYFTSRTSGFSSFAITSTAKQSSNETIKEVQNDYPEKINENNTENREPENEQKEILKTPGFVMYYGIASLFAVLLYKRK
jgi:PGF-pre-PGF domain-containing protein